MNIAIVIGVSKYTALTNLPACTTDAINMKRVLDATAKYDDVFCITDNTHAEQLKNSVRSFFSKYKSGIHVDEIFFYFSGHGVYHNDALLCCSDFDMNRPSSTSISNEELDDLIRSLSPQTTVKVIDACQSGSPYIKDANIGFEKSLSKSKLKSFVCMASSHIEQSSYASDDESIFTSRWIESALMKIEGEILYRDIQAALADAFVSDQNQTPFFVNQGTGLESFSLVTEEMRKFARDRADHTKIAPENQLIELVSSAIAKQDALYVQFEVAHQSMEEAGEQLKRANISENLVNKFYNKEVHFNDKMSSLPKSKEVATFAAEQAWEKKYFVKVKTELYEARQPKNTILAAMGGYSLSEDDYKTVTKSRPSCLESTQSLPFVVAEVRYEPENHPGLKSFLLYLGIVHSVTEVMILSAMVPLIQKDWSEREPELSEVKWQYQNYLWRDIAATPSIIWVDAIKRCEGVIKKYLESFAQSKETSSQE